MAKSGKKLQKVKRKVTKSGTSGKKWSEKWQKVAKTEAKSGKKWQKMAKSEACVNIENDPLSLLLQSPSQKLNESVINDLKNWKLRCPSLILMASIDETAST